MNLGFDPGALAKKIAKIPRLYKLIVILVINGLIFGALFYFIAIPQFETKRQLETEYDDLKQTLNRMMAIRNNMAKYRKEYAQLKETLGMMLKQLPETKDIPNLLRNVSNVGAEARIKISYFEPDGLHKKEFYAELPFVIKYAASYHNLGYFFDSIRKLDRIINITSFDMAAPKIEKGKPTKLTLNGTCLAKTYVYVKEAPKKGKKR